MHFILLRELNVVQLFVCKVKSKRCSLGRKTSEYAFVENLFVDVANVVCMEQNADAPVTLKIIYEPVSVKTGLNDIQLKFCITASLESIRFSKHFLKI